MLLKMYFILHSLIIMNKHRSSNMWSYGFAIFNALIVCAIPTLLLFFLLIEVKFKISDLFEMMVNLIDYKKHF